MDHFTIILTILLYSSWTHNCNTTLRSSSIYTLKTTIFNYNLLTLISWISKKISQQINPNTFQTLFRIVKMHKLAPLTLHSTISNIQKHPELLYWKKRRTILLQLENEICYSIQIKNSRNKRVIHPREAKVVWKICWHRWKKTTHARKTNRNKRVITRKWRQAQK